MTNEKKLKDTQEELKQVKFVLGALIAWLDRDLGRDNVHKLLEMLNSVKPTKE